MPDYDIPAFQLATPPGFQVNRTPNRNPAYHAICTTRSRVYQCVISSNRQNKNKAAVFILYSQADVTQPKKNTAKY